MMWLCFFVSLFSLVLLTHTNKQPHKLTKQQNSGEINVLVVGDPGVSKSQLLQGVHKIAPRGIYTSGALSFVCLCVCVFVRYCLFVVAVVVVIGW